MIEKFSKEELEIIKAEIKALPKDVGKRTACRDSFVRLRGIFASRPDLLGVYKDEISDHILAIADATMCNYEKMPGSEKFRRSVYVPHEIAEEYKCFVSRLCDAIIAYYRKEPVRGSVKKDED